MHSAPTWFETARARASRAPGAFSGARLLTMRAHHAVFPQSTLIGRGGFQFAPAQQTAPDGAPVDYLRPWPVVPVVSSGIQFRALRSYLNPFALLS